jgi:hypothetical protein
MSDHHTIVYHYLKTEFPGASIVDHTEHQVRWWSIQQKNTVMVLRVSKEFLTAQSEHEARALLNTFNVAETLRGSAGRSVLLTCDKVAYVPETPA